VGSDALTLLLDTHVLVWSLKDDEQLGAKAKKRIERESARGSVAVSAISFWELALLTLRKRVNLTMSGSALRAHVLGLGVQELPIDGAVADLAGRLSPRHADPADCLLVATALEHDLTLVTADTKLLELGSGLKALAANR
jgi:PIN domain nuclease of toxin-antitoxin system